MEFFRIGTQVVTTPVIAGSREEVLRQNLCDHQVWEETSQIPGLVPDGVRQKCSSCGASRYFFEEFPEEIGIEVVPVTEEEYRERIFSAQQASLKNFKKERV